MSKNPHTATVNVRMSAAAMARLRAWLATQRPAPSIVATVDTAIEDYLDRQESKACGS